MGSAHAIPLSAIATITSPWFRCALSFNAFTSGSLLLVGVLVGLLVALLSLLVGLAGIRAGAVGLSRRDARAVSEQHHQHACYLKLHPRGCSLGLFRSISGDGVHASRGGGARSGDETLRKRTASRGTFCSSARVLEAPPACDELLQ